MTYGICKLSAIALRKEDRHASEMVSQLLYNETYTVLDKTQEWLLVQTHFDHYEGWIQAKQFCEIGEEALFAMKDKTAYLINKAVSEHDGKLLSLSSPLNTSKSFKTFITCVEKSNNGFVTQWGDSFAAQFKGKRIGGVFGMVENEYNGKVTNRCELRWFCADDKADSANVPNPKTLPNSNRVVGAPASAQSIDGFLSIPDGMDEDIPF